MRRHIEWIVYIYFFVLLVVGAVVDGPGHINESAYS